MTRPASSARSIVEVCDDGRPNLGIRPDQFLGHVRLRSGPGQPPSERHELGPLIRRHVVGGTALSTRHRQLANDGGQTGANSNHMGSSRFDSVAHTNARAAARPSGSIQYVRFVARGASYLRISEYFAEGDNAAAIFGALVLPNRDTVARVNIGAANGPPVLLVEIADCVGYSDSEQDAQRVSSSAGATW